MQAHTLLKRFQRKLREDGVLSGFNAGVGYIQNSRTKVALFCRRVTAVSDAVTAFFRQINPELDAVW